MSKLTILENRIVGGYLPGLRQPASICVLRADSAWLQQVPLPALASALVGHLSTLVTREERPSTAAGLGQFLMDVIAALMQEVHVPLLEPCQLLYWDETTTCRLQLIVPVPDVQQWAPNKTLVWLTGILSRRTLALGTADLRHLQGLLETFRMQAPQGALTKRLLAAAFARDTPWLHLAENVYQFGWGVKGRLLDGTFTDRTPAIAARIARNKARAAQVLRMAGFPVSPQRQVNSADEAVQQAAQLGWPVVIKPLDLDGGQGVAAQLGDAAAVRRAFDQARQHSAHVLLEKHVAGRDYRLVVLHGRVVGVWERTPASVTGDGRQTVRELLTELNADPRRQPAAERLQQIPLDTEALELLAEQGLDAGSTPATGRSVRLRRTANIATGGSAMKLAPEAVHPDNLLMCERVVRLLRLDVAGVDLLMPDIHRSWFEGGAAICEVNAQPQLSYEYPAVVMEAVVPGNGRIPVVIVIDDPGAAGWLYGVLLDLQEAGVHAGCALGAELVSGGQTIFHTAENTAQAAHILLRDPQVQVLLFRLQDTAMLKNGFPVDRCDLLVLAGGTNFDGEHAAVARALDAGKPRIIVNAGAGLWQQWPVTDARSERVAFAGLGARVVQLLLELQGAGAAPTVTKS